MQLEAEYQGRTSLYVSNPGATSSVRVMLVLDRTGQGKYVDLDPSVAFVIAGRMLRAAVVAAWRRIAPWQ